MARALAPILARDLRHAGLSSLLDYDTRSLRSQMKHANRARVSYVVIIGDDELSRGEVGLKNMETGAQDTVARPEVVARIQRDIEVN